MKRNFESYLPESPIIGLLKKALLVVIIDPYLNGMHIKSSACHLRKDLLDKIEILLAPLKPCKIHPQISDFELFGGIDITQLHKANRTVKRKGLFGDHSRYTIITMAERMGKDLSGKVGLAIDRHDLRFIFAVDEGIEDERVPEKIIDRLAFSFDLNSERQVQKLNLNISKNRILKATELLSKVKISKKLYDQFVVVAFSLGIVSLRAPIFALRTAKALASLRGSNRVNKKDFLLAIQLTLVHKATRLPNNDALENQNETNRDDYGDSEIKSKNAKEEIPEEMIIEAVKNMLPKNIFGDLEPFLSQKHNTSGNISGAGKKILGNRRGRPKPSRKMPYDTAKRLDIPSTLRSAAPWQKIRRNNENYQGKNILISKDDLFMRRYEEKSDRVIIFAVDASGSSAFGRLGEAKGAIEFLLAEAYSQRDHVALVAFRGEKAELLLPATRSLTQARRKLAELPGGGGTPLASGLEKAIEVALASKNKGLTPTIAVMTDGKANISINGNANKIHALEDTYKFCSLIKKMSIPSIIIDTSNRPQQPAKDIAIKSDGKYLAMPKADAKILSTAISNTLN